MRDVDVPESIGVDQLNALPILPTNHAQTVFTLVVLLTWAVVCSAIYPPFIFSAPVVALSAVAGYVAIHAAVRFKHDSLWTVQMATAVLSWPWAFVFWNDFWPITTKMNEASIGVLVMTYAHTCALLFWALGVRGNDRQFRTNSRTPWVALVFSVVLVTVLVLIWTEFRHQTHLLSLKALPR